MPEEFPQVDFAGTTMIDQALLKPFVYKDVVITIAEYKAQYHMVKFLDIRPADLAHVLIMYHQICSSGGCMYYFVCGEVIVYWLLDDKSKGKIIIVIIGPNQYVMIEGFNRYVVCYLMDKCNVYFVGMCVFVLAQMLINKK
jgi:hypothetical protein